MVRSTVDAGLSIFSAVLILQRLILLKYKFSKPKFFKRAFFFRKVFEVSKLTPILSARSEIEISNFYESFFAQEKIQFGLAQTFSWSVKFAIFFEHSIWEEISSVTNKICSLESLQSSLHAFSEVKNIGKLPGS